ncbi:MAG: PEP-CTERM sorting domain-containing protein [Chromatiaceae bacterium]|nr:PEP-CTERM sorting domain-containing protein [Chromatiaceae bacterium]
MKENNSRMLYSWVGRMVAVALLYGGYLSTASAVVLTLNSASGNWGAVTGSNVSGLGTNQINWEGAGLRFDAVATPISITTDTAFALGTLSHINVPTFFSSISGATLDLDLVVTDGTTVPMAFSMNFAVQETSNSGSCPSFQVSGTPCDDRITFPTALSSVSFNIDNTDFSLLLLGFGPSAATFQPGFVTEERRTNSTLLWAELSSDAAPGLVPEPGTLALMSLGLVGLRYRTKRSKRDGLA